MNMRYFLLFLGLILGGCISAGTVEKPVPPGLVSPDAPQTAWLPPVTSGIKPITTQQEWVVALSAAIRRNWMRPAAEDKSKAVCKVFVVLLPNGEVVSAKVVQSCGTAVLDESVLRAVWKASPMPIPNDPSLFVGKLYLHFIPQ